MLPPLLISRYETRPPCVRPRFTPVALILNPLAPEHMGTPRRCWRRSTALVAMIVAPARCWITISQARFGAEAADFAASTHIMSASGTVLSYDPPDKSLGYLWSAPRRGYPLSERGLGHSITWAWDPELCDALLPMFSETFYALSLIGCEAIQAGMQRAFATWAQNHPIISFTDVTELCRQTGALRPGRDGGCVHAEVWVTQVAQVDTAASGTSTLEAAALWIPQTTTSNDFEYTNGQSRTSFTGTGAWVIETVGGRIEFSKDVCWYLVRQPLANPHTPTYMRAVRTSAGVC